MQEKIINNLKAIESKENIKILYACESGSRAWGFPSMDSDYDVRFIYIKDINWYLKVNYKYQRDVIEQPIHDLLDINGWDLRKALGLLSKSNPALIEWFNSSIVYYKDKVFTQTFQSLIQEYYSPIACFHHYSHMAKRNNHEYLQGDQVKIKKYFYVLRPILAMLWIEKYPGVVPMEFETLVDKLVSDEFLLHDIKELLTNKKQGFEAEYMPKVESISSFINTELTRLSNKSQVLGKPELSYDQLNDFFLETLKKWDI